MENVMFPFDEYKFAGTQDRFSSSIRILESVEGANRGKQISSYGAEESGESGGTDYGFYNDSLEGGLLFSKYQHQEHPQQQFPDYGLFDDIRFDVASPPIQTCLEEIAKLDEIPTGFQIVVEPKKEKRYPFSLASLELLNNYGNGFKRLSGEKIIELGNDAAIAKVASRKLSTEEIMRAAGERFIQSASQSIDAVSILSHPLGLSCSGLTDEEIKDVELAEILLASVEKVGYQHYDRAIRLLNQCDYLSSNGGNPVQRVVYYFSEALRERIDRETGRASSKSFMKKQAVNLDQAMMGANQTTLACHQGLPFGQISQFTGVQAIVENVAEAKKVHIIDLGIRNGVQWTILIQALASRYENPIELLKITAVGTSSRHLIEETGQRLISFAETLNLSLSFKVIMVSDMLELKEDLFEVDDEEKVAVYGEYVLRSMIALPNRLESIMRVIRNINPCIFAVAEVEANHNSPVFTNRFIEALFFFSAYFDCLEDCMERNDPNRMITESIYLGQGINNIVAAEGEERKIRNVKIDVWRAFFARYGMVEQELSMSSLYQASLVVKKFACGSSCTLDMDGKCLILGWKGTPVHSLSVWKFI